MSVRPWFPGSGLEELFNSNAEFRTGIRRALRDDLFVADPSMSEQRVAAVCSLSSSLMVNWQQSRTGYRSLSSLFGKLNK